MPVILDPDAAAVYKAFQEAGRPPYETVSPAEARELYLKGRFVTNPEPPELGVGQGDRDPRPRRRASGPHLHAEDARGAPTAWRPAWCFSTAAAG